MPLNDSHIHVTCFSIGYQLCICSRHPRLVACAPVEKAAKEVRSYVTVDHMFVAVAARKSDEANAQLSSATGRNANPLSSASSGIIRPIDLLCSQCSNTGYVLCDDRQTFQRIVFHRRQSERCIFASGENDGVGSSSMR